MKVYDLPRPIKNFIIKYLWFRPAIVYAYSCLDPDMGFRVLWAYVGKTRQQLEDRHSQHMGYDTRQHRQPWSDLYPSVRIVWQGRCPEFILDMIEKYYIKRYKPVYNYIHNTKNIHRLPKYQAEAQRLERDRLRNAGRVW